MYCFVRVLCTHVAGFDNVFTVNSADDFAKVDQHARPWNATCM